MDKQLWAAVAVIVAGYVIGFYFQNKRLDDFREETHTRSAAFQAAFENRLQAFERAIDKRFDDFRLWAQSEFKRLGERIDSLDKKVDAIERRLGELDVGVKSLLREKVK